MKIIGTHPYMFRSGETAEVIGVEIVAPVGWEPRWCYHVRFQDGIEDLWPASETEHYDLFV